MANKLGIFRTRGARPGQGGFRGRASAPWLLALSLSLAACQEPPDEPERERRSLVGRPGR